MVNEGTYSLMFVYDFSIIDSRFLYILRVRKRSLLWPGPFGNQWTNYKWLAARQ